MLTAAHRTRLAALADALVPAAEGMPSASAVDVAGAGIDRVLSARPDLAPEVERILDAAGDQDAGDALERLERERHMDLTTLLVAVAGAYFMHRDVRRELGYTGQEALPFAPLADLEAFIEEGLLEPVLARGPLYRVAPPTRRPPPID